jgi:hypothetical protein
MPKINSEDVKRHVSIVLNCRLPDPKFQGQTKDKLTGPKPHISVPNDLLKNIEKWKLIDNLYATLEAKMFNIIKKTNFNIGLETEKWNHINENMYLPYDENQKVFVQHDGFMNKELIPCDELAPSERPINQKWSWDRILRSVYIKQADVLQGLYFFEDQFDMDTHKRNFEFYEQFTVHERSLSPWVHRILSAKIGFTETRVNSIFLRRGSSPIFMLSLKCTKYSKCVGK